MLEKLNKEQIKLIDIIRDEWLDLFESGEEIDKDRATKAINWYYEKAKQSKPKDIYFVDSPLALQKKANELKQGKKIDKEEMEYIETFGLFYNYSWLAYYGYFQRCGYDFKFDWSDFNHYKELHLAKAYDAILFDEAAILCALPAEFNRNESGDLHSETGAAVRWRDGFEVYALNGVIVPRELITTSPKDMSASWLNREEYRNADVRAEFVRKFGIINLKKFGKVIDSCHNHTNRKDYKWLESSEYELIDMGVLFSEQGNREPALYLHMRNQTQKDLYHLETVGNDCKTILDALTFRAGGRLDFNKVEIGGIH